MRQELGLTIIVGSFFTSLVTGSVEFLTTVNCFTSYTALILLTQKGSLRYHCNFWLQSYPILLDRVVPAKFYGDVSPKRDLRRFHKKIQNIVNQIGMHWSCESHPVRVVLTPGKGDPLLWGCVRLLWIRWHPCVKKLSVLQEDVSFIYSHRSQWTKISELAQTYFFKVNSDITQTNSS